ncbi:antibiotic biosynthesis monooxygenase [Kineococcus sp. NBC_00420]|uniref:putative quinol monooxygenase n=1 Tax=Kineococcus sp. NBC_00420 TaxID=2903564 RepID=UPI002E205C29
MSVVEYLRYVVDAERAAEFETAYARAGAVLTRAPECLDWELARRTDAGTGAGEDPDPAGTVRYVLRIRWTSASEHLQGFRQGPLFREFFAAIRPYLPDVAEMRHYEVALGG